MLQMSPIHNLLDHDQVRKIEHDGNLYFSVIDVFSFLLNTDRKHAQNYYHAFKKRLRDNNFKLPLIQQFKMQAADQKFYLTDFADAEGINALYSYSESNIIRKKFRVEQRKADEVTNFHPRVIEYLQKQGWRTEHHVRLPSGHTIDIVAFSDNSKYVVECKPQLQNGNLYTAIGQVLCYQQEYNAQAVPMIATYNSKLNDYTITSCKTLNINLLTIEA